MVSNWLCPLCNEENGDLNGYCEFCYVLSNLRVYNPDKYYVREIKIQHIKDDVMSSELTGEQLLASIEANERMTPQEKLHAKLSYHETVLVKDMDDLTLSAHIEELSQIAFEARSRHGAATAEKDKRRKGSTKTLGFERNLNIDETSTNAINVIRERQKKLTKAEKVAENLRQIYKGLGAPHSVIESEVAKAMSARNMAGVVNRVQDTSKPGISNPFARKREGVQAAIDEIVNGTKPQGAVAEKKPIVNPFKKGNN